MIRDEVLDASTLAEDRTERCRLDIVDVGVNIARMIGEELPGVSDPCR